MNFNIIQNPVDINDMRQQLYKRFVAPIDGMWESLYIPSSTSHAIQHHNETIGYCCIDEDKSITQLFLSDGFSHFTKAAVSSLIASGLATSAKLSSNEPISFNACLLHNQSVAENTLCYQYNGHSLVNTVSATIEPVSIGATAAIKSFLKEQVGFDDNFGYTENLIERNELYSIEDNSGIVATGECRLSDTQLKVADIGMIVHNAHRGKGLGAEVLHQLALKAQSMNRTPICSTTHDNIPSQKSIEKAGFHCSHITFNIDFISSDKQ